MSDSDQRPPQPERAAWEGPERAPSKPDEARVGKNGDNWERDTIARLASAALTEQRRARRWNIFFKILIFLYLFMIFWLYQGKQLEESALSDGQHTALIEVQGVIADDAEASADNIVSSLRSAFKNSGTRGVILRINSPGGSPVQAGYINDEIGRLRKEYPKLPVYAVVTDICASGGYYIAVAADKIYADKASIVGSIGVRMGGLSTFGFTEAMKKLGIERRLLAAGDDKAMLDPFSPLRPEEVEHSRRLLENIHQQFIQVVKQGRGNRLKGDDHMLFNGLYWTGEQSVELGLIDGLSSSSQVARDIVGAEKIVDFTRHPSPLERFADRLGVVMVKAMASMAEVPATKVW